LALGYLYPTVGFAVWYYAPQVVFPSQYPGGATSFVASAGLFGLMWGRVSFRNGTIGWSTISYVLLDFSGLSRHYRATSWTVSSRRSRRFAPKP
jgi:hypothetical protein